MSNTSDSSTTLASPASRQALERLAAGNRRFVEGIRSVEALTGHTRMPDLAAKGQKPFAVILTCSDSRSPVELIFDQGVGDLFVVRVAGNVVAPSLLASIEFAVANFGSAAIVVLGHTLCGAVNATIQHARDSSKPLPSAHLEELVGRIRPAVEATERECKNDHPEFLHRATLSNIKRSQALILEQSRIVRDLFEAGKLTVTGAILDISNGKVTFLEKN